MNRRRDLSRLLPVCGAVSLIAAAAFWYSVSAARQQATARILGPWQVVGPGGAPGRFALDFHPGGTVDCLFRGPRGPESVPATYAVLTQTPLGRAADLLARRPAPRPGYLIMCDGAASPLRRGGRVWRGAIVGEGGGTLVLAEQRPAAPTVLQRPGR